MTFSRHVGIYNKYKFVSLYYYKTPSQFSTLGKCVGYDSLSMMRNIPMPQSHIVMIVEDGKEN
jgi:hypothetical protein